MSKKKPTAPIPLTGTVTITTDGRTTLAMKASHRGEDIEVSTGLSHCRPGDVYSEYEGARIALARLYGLDPFPQEDKPQEKGHWEKATGENTKVGSRVKVVAAYNTGGQYHNGDQGVVHDFSERNPTLFCYIQFNGNKAVTKPGCWVNELEVWVPDAPEEAKPQEAPAPEAPKPFTPSFQVGDIVWLGEGENVFARDCRGKVGKVCKVGPIGGDRGAHYSLWVKRDSRSLVPQDCLEWPDDPAPLELLFRDPRKDGEEA